MSKEYKKNTSENENLSNLSKTDILADENRIRFHGEFFTPIPFAHKALEYIDEILGKNWCKSGEYRIWDMAAGIGNLENGLPKESHKYIYLSTLFVDEIEYCKKLFPEATSFQYDYLNDDINNVFGEKSNWKLPKKLRDDLSNPKLKWIILINPPFATSQDARKKGKSKQDVSNTEVRKIMHQHNLGEASRELAMQFIFRMKKELNGKEAFLGLFYKIKHINSNNDKKLRDHVFKFTHKKGFMFSSSNFSGTSKNSPFPVAFMLWDIKNEQHLENQEIVVDILNENVEKIGTKKISSLNRKLFLSKWIKRPAAVNKFPPLGSAINIKSGNKDRRDRIANNFLASFMCAGNDFQSQNQTALASAPFVSAGAMSVTPENFEKAMVVHAVRRIPRATWLNDRDQFLQPKQELSQEFINDCTIWNIFGNSNQTAAMKDVEYEGQIYQIKNHFFPFLISELKNWEITDSDFSLALASAEDRFVAKWCSEKEFSSEAKEVIETAKIIYKFYFANLNKLRTNLFEIKTWDAGLWQIKKVLQDQNLSKDLFKNLKEKHNILRQKILPQIYDYGFIPKIET